jgi:uncharacterized membrane protein
LAGSGKEVDAVSHDRFRYGLIAVAYGLGVILFLNLPAIWLPGRHFPLWSFPRISTAFTLPTAALVIALIFKSLAKRDPLRRNYEKFRLTYELCLDLAVVLAIGTHLLILSKLMIYQGMVGRWITYVPTSLMGIILVLVGNVLPRLRPNSALGIRTRWTLRDQSVWMKTHRAGGYFLFVFGLALIVCTVIDFMSIWWLLGPGLVLTVAGLPLLSYFLSKGGRKSSPHTDAAAKENSLCRHSD